MVFLFCFWWVEIFAVWSCTLSSPKKIKRSVIFSGKVWNLLQLYFSLFFGRNHVSLRNTAKKVGRKLFYDFKQTNLVLFFLFLAFNSCNSPFFPLLSEVFRFEHIHPAGERTRIRVRTKNHEQFPENWQCMLFMQ